MKPDYNISQEELEHIERYINKTMTLEESAAFEKKLESNLDFKKQVEDIETILLGIETQALKEKLEEFHNELPETDIPSKEPSKLKYLNFTKLVAAAAILIAAGSFWYFSESSNTNLYSKFYTPDPGLPTTMSTTDDFTFYDAMVNYKRKDYMLALSKWESLLKNKPENDTLNYFIGSAYLAKGDENQAIPYLLLVSQNEKSIFKNEAFYYLGLAYLKAENIELAKKNLKFSTMDNSKDILSELED